MKLGELQRSFAKILPCLIRYAYKRGYEITLGEAWRPAVTAEYYAKIGKGTVNSLHRSRLAIDLNLFKNGKWLTKSEDYKFLGEYWEKLGKKETWL